MKIYAMYVDIICLLTGKLIDPNAVIVEEFKMNKYRQTTLDEFGFEFYEVPKEIVWRVRELLRFYSTNVKEEE